MKAKIFAPEEISKMIPLISQIASDIVDTYGEAQAALQALEVEKVRAQSDLLRGTAVRERDSDLDWALDRLQGLIDEIEALGGTVKDYEVAAIDFYGELNGRIVCFCWEPGEVAIKHWRRVDEGVAKRRPLSSSAA